MKKVLIGCGIVVLLFVALLAAVGTYFGVKAAKYGKSMEAAGQSVVQLNKDFAFAAPDAGVSMDPARFNAYLDARARLVAKAREIPLIVKITSSKPGGPPPDIGPGDLLGLVRDIPKLIQSYADELRAAGMSTDEYAWISTETVKAIRTAGEQGDAEYVAVWQKLEKAADEAEKAIANSNNRDPNVQAAMKVFKAEMQSISETTAPEDNVRLVVGAKEKLTEDSTLLIVELMIAIFLNQTIAPAR